MSRWAKAWCPKGPDKRGPYSGLWVCYINTTRSATWRGLERGLGEKKSALYRAGWRVVKVVVREETDE